MRRAGASWLAIGVLCAILGAAVALSSDAALGLVARALLPAAMVHLFLVFPEPRHMARAHPAVLWLPYVACGALAGIALAAGTRSPQTMKLIEAATLWLTGWTVAGFSFHLVSVAISSSEKALRRAALWGLLGVTSAAAGYLGQNWYDGSLSAALVLPLALAIGTVVGSGREGEDGRSANDAPAPLELEVLTRGMAHALRKPLDRLASNLAAMAPAAPEEPRIPESLDLVSGMQDFIGDVLALARARESAERRTIAASQVIEQAVRQVRALHPDATIEMDLTNSGLIVADEVALRTAVANLIENAVEARPSDAWARITSVLEDDLREIRIEVEDRSGGLSADIRDRIFEPFVTSKPRGIGLGLVIVRETCEAHGGSVEFRDARGGTRFVLRLPIASA